MIVATLFGFEPREFFDAPAAAEATPEVSLSPGPAVACRLTLAAARALAALALAGAGAGPQRRHHRRRRRAAARPRRRACWSPSDLTFDYDGHFEGSYRDILLLPRRADHRRPRERGRPALRARRQHGARQPRPPRRLRRRGRSAGRVRIVWHYRATDEQRTHDDLLPGPRRRRRLRRRARHRLGGLGRPVGLRPRPPDRELHQPGARPGDPLYRVWGHPRDVEGETARGDGGRRSRRATSQRHSGRAAGDDAARPGPGRQPGRGSRRATGCRRSSPRSRRSTTTSTRPGTRSSASSPTTRSLLALAIAALASLALVAARRLARERDVGVPEYLPEPPDDATPALAYGLAHEGGDSTNTVLATLLDLVDRGYYETEQATTRRREARPGAEQKARSARAPRS